MGLEPKEKGDLKLMVTEVYGIERYWVAVGPRVMVPDYPFIDGEQIPSDKMKYGTCIDVILRDSDYNTYFMPAIVGDIKEHTLGSGYAKGVDIDGKEISTGTDSGIGSINGIYQTGYSWKDGEFAEEYKEGYDKPNGTVIEFIRPKGTKDNLLRTSEFDILGIIVYD